jgi:DNA-binding transcriptional regulator YhcF (GntR family)
MIVEIDPNSHVPPYEQIRAQVTTMIDAGVLAAGVRLPSIRQLAADLGLAANTVARSYRELEAAGLVVSRVGNGTAVTARRTMLSAADRQQRLGAAADAYLATAARLGSTADEAVAMLRTRADRPAPG